MDLLHTLILSTIEGITEFLPVSSTGHLILAAKLLNIPQTDFQKTFEIVIQLGAIMSVVVLFGKRLISSIQTLKMVLVAFIPTGILGFVLYKTVKEFLLESAIITVISLFIGGVILILVERYFIKKDQGVGLDKLTFKSAFGVGVIQSISMIPGVSRSAATILGGMFLGLSKEAAVELSFLLAIPTMFAATSYDLYKNVGSFQTSQLTSLSIGFIVSFIVALIVVKLFLGAVRKYSLAPFGVYRIILAVIFFLLIL